tara:strand:- start:270 stop:551 length:282 start_codon:yes stop_codon:yes gene_type:complete
MGLITATTVTADGVAVNSPTRVKKLYYIYGTGAGSIVLKDGGATGDTLLTMTIPTTATGEASGSITIPEGGIKFNTNVYVDVTSVSSVTVFHG